MTPIDTFNVYENKCGVNFRVYKAHWFGRDYGFTHSDLNAQDSLVLLEGKPKHLKVYNSKNILIFESNTTHYGFMIGDVVFYNANGSIEHIEHRNDELNLKSCPDSASLSFECPMRFGTWKYFRKDGSLKRVKRYTLQSDSCSVRNFNYYCEVVSYRRSGKIASQRNKKSTYRKFRR